MSGDSLVVHGFMSPAQSAGCRFSRHSDAVCPLAGVSSVEVDMGPADDKVEVLDRLPIPLTTFLGKGSDKLIGNGERGHLLPAGHEAQPLHRRPRGRRLHHRAAQQRLRGRGG